MLGPSTTEEKPKPEIRPSAAIEAALRPLEASGSQVVAATDRTISRLESAPRELAEVLSAPPKRKADAR
jgi:hypothetical protein